MPEETNSQQTLMDAMSTYSADVLGIKEESNGQEAQVQAPQEVAVPAADQPPAVDEPTQQAATTPPTEAPPAPAAEDWFNIEKINQRFGTEFKTEDEIKEAVSSLSTNREFLNKRDYYAQIDKFIDEIHPLKLFGSKENYDRYMLRETLVQHAPDIIVDTILSTDMGKVDGLQAMFLETVYKDPGILEFATEEDIKKGLLARMNIDIEDPEFDLSNYQAAAKTNPRALLELSMGGTQAKTFFGNLLGEAKKGIPELKDFKQEFELRAQEQATQIQKRSAEWSAKAQELSSEFKEFRIMEKGADGKEFVDFTFSVPQEFTNSVANYVVDYAVQSGLDVTPETVARIKTEVQEAFEDRYRAEIRKAYKDEKLAKFKEELDNKVNNNKPINTTEAPEGHGNSYKDEVDAQRQHFGL